MEEMSEECPSTGVAEDVVQIDLVELHFAVQKEVLEVGAIWTLVRSFVWEVAVVDAED